MPRVPRHPDDSAVHGMIPAKYLPVIISSVVAAVVGGGGATLIHPSLDPIATELGNLRREKDALHATLIEADKRVSEHEVKLAALEKKTDASESRTTDALRAINQQLDYVLKNLTARRS